MYFSKWDAFAPHHGLNVEKNNHGLLRVKKE